MSKFTRPTFNVDDDDLERLQQEFFAKETMPSAKVYRKSAPSMDQPKKRSLFSERLQQSTQSDMPSIAMPTLENPTEPEPTPPMPTLETRIEDIKEEEERAAKSKKASK